MMARRGFGRGSGRGFSVAARRPRNDDDRILPLINVVFLLLIFFMIAGKLTTSDPFRIDPPTSISQGESGSEEVTVLIGPDGRIAVNGIETEGQALTRTLGGEKESIPQTVRLKADGAAPADLLVSVMERLREAGVQKVRLLTVTGAEG